MNWNEALHVGFILRGTLLARLKFTGERFMTAPPRASKACGVLKNYFEFESLSSFTFERDLLKVCRD